MHGERLDLLYPDHYTLQFSNGSQGAAHIQLSLPYEPLQRRHEYPLLVDNDRFIIKALQETIHWEALECIYRLQSEPSLSHHS